MDFDALNKSLSDHRAPGSSSNMRGIIVAALIGLGLLAGPCATDASAFEESSSVQDQLSTTAVPNYLRAELESREGLVWTGHTNPDTDSVVASMLAAFIYGGRSSVPAPINPESRFAVDECGTDAPEVIEDFSGKQVGLVDFNQSTQLPKGVDPESIAAILDHHAIGGSPIVIPDVITFEIRPWGSMATILADQARILEIELPVPLACIAMAAILSDTVNLTLPTTTKYDKAYAAKLAKRAGIDDFNDFAERMLLAKSDLSGLSADEIILLDYKNFGYGGRKVGIGVAETLTAQKLIDRRDELASAIEAWKAKSGLDHVIFAIIDTRDQKSYLLWGDDEDKAIVTSAFGDDVVDDMVVADDVISRKRQIGPAIQRAVENRSGN